MIVNDNIKLMQNTVLNVMSFFHRFCEEHGLIYYLAYGSCLGAIRHHGFIPWDDDIDVLMPLDDYNRMILLFAKENSDRYKIASYKNTKNYIYPFAKIYDSNTKLKEKGIDGCELGAYIDVFPIYKAPNNSSEQKKFFKKTKRIRTLYEVSRKKSPIGKNIITTVAQILIFPFVKFIGVNYFLNKYINVLQRYNDNETDFSFGFLPSYGRKEIMQNYIFSQRELVDFENCKFYVMSHYKEYLSNIYGNYLELPPKEKRVSHHHYTLEISDEFLNS